MTKNKKKAYRNIELGTVDAFQGNEKDIIIISTARSNDKIYKKALGEF